MADFTHVVVDADGWAHSNALHTDHFPRLLWEMLMAFGYTEPPQYTGRESSLLGTARCHMIVKIPPCPSRLDWESWQSTVFGRKLADSWEIVARKAIEEFTEKHTAEIVDTPYSVIPLKDETTQAWAERVNRNLNYMMPDYNARTALSFRYSTALAHMYEQLREENVECRSQAREAHIRQQNMNDTTDRIRALKAKSHARKLRIQELTAELANRTQMVEHLEGQLQEAHEMVDDVQAQVQALADMAAVEADEDSEEEEEEELEEIQGESGVESGPGTP